ncbi:MAG: amidohydrolase family protein [Planctomycetota bacterium]|nr:amidohydrolase family protein [Planctomycetota bacterium]
MLDGKEVFTMPEDLIRHHDAVGIEKAVLLPMVSPEGITESQSNEEIIALCRTYPDRFVPFCNLDPRAMTNSPDAPLGDILRQYRDKGCKGIGEITANLSFEDLMVQNLFRHAQETGMPVTFHVSTKIGGTYGLYDYPGLPQLERSLRAFPDLKFFGHSQAFWAEMAPLATPADRGEYPNYPVTEEGVVPKLFRRYPNLHGDLSAGSGCNALARDPDYAAKFLDEFQDRLMFGTDITTPGTPTPLVDLLLKFRDEKRISEEIFQKVARENTIRLLGL